MAPIVQCSKRRSESRSAFERCFERCAAVKAILVPASRKLLSHTRGMTYTTVANQQCISAVGRQHEVGKRTTRYRTTEWHCRECLLVPALELELN